ncbi:methyltransferase domain-containing protein [Zeaxanthinibacter enoshimensis]|uniref:Methyltransferase family protein n=1 Tax=Zeaxanthinibacter enoshimensis TaxID=392009 RepID=A0A4R6TN80_9FLAO|nr:methyltransferase domain-containing protein [Zeaxanthinibacter enoshimensis]TDQ31348.1 methyltransferase family protein [Zeaxanthinibacter enoshimensis]
MTDFSKRSRQAEAMDDPGLGVQELDRVFKDLNRTNVLLAGQRITLSAVSKLLKPGYEVKYHIADMGCGDGDMLRRLAKHCRKRGIGVTLTGIDNSDAALEIARRKSKTYPEITFFKGDLLQLETFSCDILLCTLTLHHFPDDKISRILDNFSRSARQAIIIQELQRNRVAYYLFKLFSLIFIKTKIAKEDGLISIRSGFREKELEHFADQLSEWQHTIRWQWLFRYLWVIQAKAPRIYD